MKKTMKNKKNDGFSRFFFFDFSCKNPFFFIFPEKNEETTKPAYVAFREVCQKRNSSYSMKVCNRIRGFV